MEYSMNLVSVLDESGTILYQSPSAERILGEHLDVRVGTNTFEYIHPDGRTRITEQFLSMVQSPGSATERVEYRFEHGDSSWAGVQTVRPVSRLCRLGFVTCQRGRSGSSLASRRAFRRP